MKTNAIILFTRIPIPGETKTRLEPLLSKEECCLLQRAFLQDIYQALKKVKTDADIIICYAPKGSVADLEELLPEARAFIPQQGLDIGERMYNAISRVLDEGYSKCILIGSDLPLLRAEALDEAFFMLENSDMVICPTEDGGYYLIGMKEPCKDVFRLQYGVSTVFERTLEAAALAGKTCATGACTMDIDEPKDLYQLRRLTRENPSSCPQTRKILGELFR